MRCVPSWHHSHHILRRTCLHLSLASPHSPASARCVAWTLHGGDLSQKCHHGKAGMRPVRAITSRVVEKTGGSISWDCKMQRYSDKSLLLPQLLTWKCSFNPPFLKCALLGSKARKLKHVLKVLQCCHGLSLRQSGLDSSTSI